MVLISHCEQNNNESTTAVSTVATRSMDPWHFAPVPPSRTPQSVHPPAYSVGPHQQWESALIRSPHRMMVALKLPTSLYYHADASESDSDSLWSTDGDGAPPGAYWDTVDCCSLNYSRSCCSTVLLRSNCWGSTCCCRGSGGCCTSWCPTLTWMSCWTWGWGTWGMNWCILVGVQVTLKKKTNNHIVLTSETFHFVPFPKVTYLSKRSKPQLELIRKGVVACM